MIGAHSEGKFERPERADWSPQIDIRCGCVIDNQPPLLAILARAARRVPSVENTTMLIDGEWTTVSAGEWLLFPLFRRQQYLNGARVARGVGHGVTRRDVLARCRSCDTEHLLDRQMIARAVSLQKMTLVLPSKRQAGNLRLRQVRPAS